MLQSCGVTSEYIRRFVYKSKGSTLREFIEFWEPRYFAANENLYTKNIRKAQTDESLRQLFLWKGEARYLKESTALWKSIVKNFVSQRSRVANLPANISAKDFLETEFSTGGAIYRIFWLHCWYPNRFPIYDQHVHRAMTFIVDGQPDELDKHNDSRKIALYLECYIPFYKPYAKIAVPFDAIRDGVRSRKADRALFTFGKCLPTSSLPPLKPRAIPFP